MDSLNSQSAFLREDPTQDTDLDHFKFVYKPLPTATSIRLLHLQLGVGDGAVIRLSTRTVDLDDKPQYDALSYTWGRPKSVFETKEERDNLEDQQLPVICDDQIVSIGRNLYDFISAWQRMLQAAGDVNDERTVGASKAGLLPPTELWIDAIAINQRDVDEKNSQVSMMGRIYSQSQKVIIWLGPEDSFTRPALQIIFKMQGIKQLQARACRSIGYDDGCKTLGLPPITSSIWWSVFAFLHRSWFLRVWVMQELAFAPQIQMQCGLLTFPWATLSKAAAVLYESDLGDIMDRYSWMELNGPKLNEPLFLEDLTPIWTTEERLDSDRNLFSTSKEQAAGGSFRNIIRLESIRVGDGSRLVDGSYGFRLGTNSKEIIPSVPILHLFDSTRISKSSDARDKIYAILDVARRDVHDSDLVSPYRRPLVPNYHLDTEEVYLEAAWYILLSGNDLELLSRTNLGSENKDSGLRHLSLPSWVPDWSMTLNVPSMWALKPFKDGNWSASRNVFWVQDNDSSVYGQILSVQGALVDVVADVVESESFSLSKSGVVAASLPAVYPWVSEESAPGDVLWRTLIANYDESNYPASGDFKGVFHESWIEEQKRAYSEHYCEEGGLSDPEKEAEWHRFVNHTFTIFPQEEELFEATSKTEMKAENGLESAVPSPQRNHEKLQQNPRQHDAQPTPHLAVTEMLPIQIEQLSIHGMEPEHEKEERTEENHPVLSNLDPANQALSQFDIIMKQILKSAEFPTSGPDVANGADNKVERKEKHNSQETNSDEDQAATQPSKMRSLRFEKKREFDRLMSFSSGRSIFRTHENYLGNGSRSIRPGDQIWILAGAKIPFVLRLQENGKHVLVGDSYVHGIMYGEAFKRPGFEFVDIQLK